MKKITPESLYDFKFVSAPTISPDGSMTAFVVSFASKDTNSYLGNIWILDNATGDVKQLTSGGDGKSFIWTEKNTILFPCQRCPKTKNKAEAGEPVTAYYEIDPKGSEARKAFEVPETVAAIKEMGEGKYICLYIHDKRYDAIADLKGEERAAALKEIKDPSYYQLEDYPFWWNGRHITSGKRTMLGIFDTATGELKPLTDVEFECGNFDYKDGVIVYAGSPITNVNNKPDGVYKYTVATGETECLLAPDSLCDCMLLGIWGDKALMAATDGLIPVPDSSGLNFERDQYDDFYTLDLATGELTLLAKYEASIGHGSVGSDARLGGGRGFKVEGDKAYFLTTVDDSAFLRTIDKDGNISENLTPVGSCDSFDVKDGKVIYCGLYGKDIAELYAGCGKRLTHFSNIDEYSYCEPEMHVFTNKDGYEIHGWALKPAGYEPGKTYPAILHIHGGPRTVFGDVFHHEMEMWANAGYFVFFCNPRGSDGRGNDFGFISGKYGTIDFDDLMAFTDEMLKKYPEVDPKRVGVTGGSYGGFMTNWIIGHTDRFVAAASQRSIANWTTFEYTTDIGLTFAEGQMRATTDTNIEKMWFHSPLKYAKNCKTPTLFIHSDNDFRCWMSEGLSMFTALKKANVETKLCLFRGETHELSRSGKPKNRISRMTEILNWMDKYCK